MEHGIGYIKMLCADLVSRSARTKFYNWTFTMILFTNLYENYTIAFSNRFLMSAKF